MTNNNERPDKTSARKRADVIKPFRCKHVIAVIENPQLLENVGSVIRNVNAFGISRVYVVDSRKLIPDNWYTMRHGGRLFDISVSAVKWSFVKRFDSTETCITHLKKNNFVSFVTSPHVKGKINETLDQVDFTKPSKLAIWFGNESKGISDLAVENAALCVSIPMFGMIESLNLGTASGVVLYEVGRQRRTYQAKYRKRNQRAPIEEKVNETAR
ncbi:MAG TPA: RNA methyltransferase [Anaerolineales bacterium]|nr:RNA methyltransferase [Anaerolineales bacterium]